MTADDGATMLRVALVELSSQLLKENCVPTLPLCTVAKLTAQVEPGIQERICGVTPLPGAQPAPVTAKVRPAGLLVMVAFTPATGSTLNVLVTAVAGAKLALPD